MKKYSTLSFRLLLARLREFTVENPRQAERRAEYLKRVRKLVRSKKARAG